jgi:hypothetical protein
VHRAEHLCQIKKCCDPGGIVVCTIVYKAVEGSDMVIVGRYYHIFVRGDYAGDEAYHIAPYLYRIAYEMLVIVPLERFQTILFKVVTDIFPYVLVGECPYRTPPGTVICKI